MAIVEAYFCHGMEGLILRSLREPATDSGGEASLGLEVVAVTRD